LTVSDGLSGTTTSLPAAATSASFFTLALAGYNIRFKDSIAFTTYITNITSTQITISLTAYSSLNIY
jgi:hypothetical protein